MVKYILYEKSLDSDLYYYIACLNSEDNINSILKTHKSDTDTDIELIIIPDKEPITVSFENKAELKDKQETHKSTIENIMD